MIAPGRYRPAMPLAAAAAVLALIASVILLLPGVVVAAKVATGDGDAAVLAGAGALLALGGCGVGFAFGAHDRRRWGVVGTAIVQTLVAGFWLFRIYVLVNGGDAPTGVLMLVPTALSAVAAGLAFAQLARST
jgi:hypothetical protein